MGLDKLGGVDEERRSECVGLIGPLLVCRGGDPSTLAMRHSSSHLRISCGESRGNLVQKSKSLMVG